MSGRLLLVELYGSGLRRGERCLLFPFFKGLAQQHGCATLWLCYGVDAAHVDPGAARRPPLAALAKGDLRSLAGHLERFRPTHIMAGNRLYRKAEDLLAACTSRTVGTPGGSAYPSRRGDFVRCGWFLDWLSSADSTTRERPIVEYADPDYAVVPANRAAMASPPRITILSGVMCADRRTVAGNPYFAGLDLSGNSHRGCSFCRCATLPAYTSPGADLLAVLETQFRSVLETAPKAGRTKRCYEFYDIRAFWRFDEVFEVILRLEVPPAVFLFNPRIDDVLRMRGRIERMLPALARAGHEVHILSMGIENFSERENARLNKGIRPAQVDELLALTERWARTYGPVFRPFKGGNGAIELGMILFTPWTTLADLRINLDSALARRFPPRGYWLYSALFLDPATPIFRLAGRDGVLVDRFPDRGQAYALVKSERESLEAAPWRFLDAKVADYFSLLVRVCAADGEGPECPFFQGDAAFALACRLCRQAVRRGETTPLQIALALLGLMEAAPPPYSREALLRKAVARASARSPAVRARRAAAERSAQAEAVARVVDRLRQARPGMLHDVEFKPVEELALDGSRRIRLTLSMAGRVRVVDLLDARSQRPCFLRSRHFRAVYHDDAPPPSLREREQLSLLLGLVDAGIDAALQAAPGSGPDG